MARELAALSDEELFRLCRRTRDPAVIRQAVAKLAERHQRGLVRYLWHMLGSLESAEDMAQEAFIRIYRHAREYRDIAKVSTWLYHIGHNLALNEIRDRKRRAMLSLNAQLGGAAEGRGELGEVLADGREPGPARWAEARDTSERVRRAIEALPEPYRAVMLLCDLEALSYQETAEVLEIKIGTVRSRLFRARERLAEMLAPAVRRDGL